MLFQLLARSLDLAHIKLGALGYNRLCGCWDFTTLERNLGNEAEAREMVTGIFDTVDTEDFLIWSQLDSALLQAVAFLGFIRLDALAVFVQEGNCVDHIC